MRNLAMHLFRAVLASALVTGAVSAAEPTPEQKRADELFVRANHLADQGNFAAACPLYEQSNGLDPAIGTQFNMADCDEHVGRLATALAQFREVERTAHAAGKAERRDSAQQRADALEKRVGRIRVTVSAAAAALPDLVVRCDDTVMAGGDLGKPLPFDAGVHAISVVARDRLAWSKNVQVEDGQGTTVVVPELVSPGPAVPAPSDRPAAGGSTQKTLAYVAGGVGLAGLAVGTVFGFLSLAEHNTYEGLCKGGSCTGTTNPDQAVVSDSGTAVTEGTVSTVAFIAGGVGVAGAIVLWFTAPKYEGNRPAAWRVEPIFGAGKTGVDLRGSF